MTPAAITFDFWSTLFEVQRDRIVGPREEAVGAILAEAGHEVPREHLSVAFEGVARIFDERWRENVQYRFADGLAHVMATLGIDDDELREAIGGVWLDVYRGADVAPIPDAAEAVRGLADAGVPLGIVCDVSLIPSSLLEDFLARAGLLDCFGALAWSDQVGVYKPEPAIFRYALRGVGVDDPAAAVHVGDKRRTDVAGAKALGMKTVRYTGAVDDEGDPGDPEADHVIADHRELFDLVL